MPLLAPCPLSLESHKSLGLFLPARPFPRLSLCGGLPASRYSLAPPPRPPFLVFRACGLVHPLCGWAFPVWVLRKVSNISSEGLIPVPQLTLSSLPRPCLPLALSGSSSVPFGTESSQQPAVSALTLSLLLTLLPPLCPPATGHRTRATEGNPVEYCRDCRVQESYSGFSTILNSVKSTESVPRLDCQKLIPTNPQESNNSGDTRRAGTQWHNNCNTDASPFHDPGSLTGLSNVTNSVIVCEYPLLRKSDQQLENVRTPHP